MSQRPIRVAPRPSGQGPPEHPRNGTAAWYVDDGAGIFAGATGRIVSNFLLSQSGDLTDHHVGVLFLQGGRALC